MKDHPDRTTRLHLLEYMFACRAVSCPQKIFTERLPELIEPSSRLTTRLRTLVQAICSAFNAKGGAHLGEQLGIHFTRETFLRSLHLLSTPPVGNVKAVGIDDFAWKRGKRYGTVIIDLETHRLLDILPDREAESVKQWLAAHPEIEIVSRDRAGAYADGAAQGAPQALQIADRWHVCKNLGDAVQDDLVRKKIQMPPSSSPNVTTEQVAAACAPPPPLEPGPCRYASQEKCERKQMVVDQVKTLQKQGHSACEIAASLHLARNTVRKYLRLEGPVQPTSRPRRLSQRGSLLCLSHGSLERGLCERSPAFSRTAGKRLSWRGDDSAQFCLTPSQRASWNGSSPKAGTASRSGISPHNLSQRVALAAHQARGRAYARRKR
jgi:DNA-binding NarL/FixJ family response regulator